MLLKVGCRHRQTGVSGTDHAVVHARKQRVARLCVSATLPRAPFDKVSAIDNGGGVNRYRCRTSSAS